MNNRGSGRRLFNPKGAACPLALSSGVEERIEQRGPAVLEVAFPLQAAL